MKEVCREVPQDKNSLFSKPGDDLILRSTAMSCSERETWKRKRAEQRKMQRSIRLDRWYNLEKESDRESYEFKNWWRQNGPGSRANNLGGFTPLLMGRVLALMDGFPTFLRQPSDSPPHSERIKKEEQRAGCKRMAGGEVISCSVVSAHHRSSLFMVWALTQLVWLLKFLWIVVIYFQNTAGEVRAEEPESCFLITSHLAAMPVSHWRGYLLIFTLKVLGSDCMFEDVQFTSY